MAPSGSSSPTRSSGRSRISSPRRRSPPVLPPAASRLPRRSFELMAATSARSIQPRSGCRAPVDDRCRNARHETARLDRPLGARRCRDRSPAHGVAPATRDRRGRRLARRGQLVAGADAAGEPPAPTTPTRRPRSARSPSAPSASTCRAKRSSPGSSVADSVFVAIVRPTVPTTASSLPACGSGRPPGSLPARARRRAWLFLTALRAQNGALAVLLIGGHVNDL